MKTSKSKLEVKITNEELKKLAAEKGAKELKSGSNLFELVKISSETIKTTTSTIEVGEWTIETIQESEYRLLNGKISKTSLRKREVEVGLAIARAVRSNTKIKINEGDLVLGLWIIREL